MMYFNGDDPTFRSPLQLNAFCSVYQVNKIRHIFSCGRNQSPQENLAGFHPSSASSASLDAEIKSADVKKKRNE